MGFTDAASKAAALQKTVELGKIPTLAVPDGAGVRGCHRLAIQIAITQKDGQMVGLCPNTYKGKAHRLEVVRMVAFGDEGLTPEQEAALTWRVSPDDLGDTYLRPKSRHTLMMHIGGPMGLGNIKPWTAVYRQIAGAADWVQMALQASRGGTQYGLLMVVDTTDWLRKSWEDKRGRKFPYNEAQVTAVTYMELIELIQPDADEVELRALDQEDLDLNAEDELLADVFEK